MSVMLSVNFTFHIIVLSGHCSLTPHVNCSLSRPRYSTDTVYAPDPRPVCVQRLSEHIGLGLWDTARGELYLGVRKDTFEFLLNCLL